MRKIERQMLNAISARRNWKSNNTRVEVSEPENYVKVYLHGNCIFDMAYNGGTAVINLCGWNTVTTRSRLSILVNYYSEDYVGVGTKRGQVELRGMSNVPNKSIDDNGWIAIK